MLIYKVKSPITEKKDIFKGLENITFNQNKQVPKGFKNLLGVQYTRSFSPINYGKVLDDESDEGEAFAFNERGRKIN